MTGRTSSEPCNWSAASAARIWTVSNLGKYLPGKVWAIAGMALMARQAGVSPAAATGSASALGGPAAALGAMAGGFLVARTLLGFVDPGNRAQAEHRRAGAVRLRGWRGAGARHGAHLGRHQGQVLPGGGHRW